MSSTFAASAIFLPSPLRSSPFHVKQLFVQAQAMYIMRVLCQSRVRHCPGSPWFLEVQKQPRDARTIPCICFIDSALKCFHDSSKQDLFLVAINGKEPRINNINESHVGLIV